MGGVKTVLLLFALLFVFHPLFSFCKNYDNLDVSSEYGSMSGGYTDATWNPNFHTGSGTRSVDVGTSFVAFCEVSTDTPNARFEFRIANISGWDSVTFPPQLMTVPKGIPTGASNTPVQIQRDPHVWAYVESLNQPIGIIGFTDNRTAIAEMRLLVPTGAAGYKKVDPLNPNAKTMFYNVRFVMKGLRPNFYGTRASMPTRESDGTYSARITTKFTDNAMTGATLYTPLSTATSFVPLSQTRVYVRLMKSDASTRGQWVNVIRPVVEKYELPLYNNTQPDYDAERNGVYEPSYMDTTSTVGIVNGIVSGAVDKYGYVNLILKNLSANTEYTCYISAVPTNSKLETLLASDETDPDYFLFNLAVLTQPMRPCTFRTSPNLNDAVGMARPVKIWAGSCIEGPGEVWEGVPEQKYDLIIFNGDVAYQDNLGKNRPDDVGDDEQDFLRNYERSLRDDALWLSAISAANAHTMSDHEVQDGWEGFIMFALANAAKWQLTAQETALMNAVAAIPLFRAKTPFDRVTVIPNGNLVKNQRVIDAYNAFVRSMPGFPPGKNPYSRNFAEYQGHVLTVFINSNPIVFSDGSIEYSKANAFVPKGSETNPSIQNTPGTFIPKNGELFLKNVLLAEKAKRKKGEPAASVVLVVFSDRISPAFPAEKVNKFRANYVQMASIAMPTVSSEVAESAFNKTFYLARGTTSDVFPEQFEDLNRFFEEEDLSNIIFVTGDAHNSAITPINAKRAIWEASTSTIGNFKASGSIYQFLGSPADGPTGSVALSENSYAHIESNAFPTEPSEKPHVDINLMYGQKVQARKRVYLVNPKRQN